MEFTVGQKIAFYCHARNRGGHVVAYATVTKVNRKTVDMTETPNSYGAGTKWRCNKEWLLENLATMWNSHGYNQFNEVV